MGGDHYKSMPIQPHYFCHVNGLGALESNVIKYVCRHNAKNGKADLLKARHYIDLLLEWQYGEVGQVVGGLDQPVPPPPPLMALCKCGYTRCTICDHGVP